MVTPLADRWSVAPATAAHVTATPERLPVALRSAVAQIAGAAGAWCPVLSPEGDRVADVTDRSGFPRLEVVTAGIAEPGRVGAHGWSYGGYLTLVALTRWPDLFAAGVSGAGMSDLRTFFAGTEPWTAAASVTECSDPVADRDLLLLPGEGHPIVGREHLVELSERIVAWFDRWL
jgi:hypothetical protein